MKLTNVLFFEKWPGSVNNFRTKYFGGYLWDVWSQMVPLRRWNTPYVAEAFLAFLNMKLFTKTHWQCETLPFEQGLFDESYMFRSFRVHFDRPLEIRVTHILPELLKHIFLILFVGVIWRDANTKPPKYLDAVAEEVQEVSPFGYVEKWFRPLPPTPANLCHPK